MLNDIAAEKKCFLICITESHLNDYISLNETEINGYEQVRSDRKKRMGGGVICFVNDSIPITNSLSYSNGYCELVCLNLSSINTVNISLYRPPGCPLDKFMDVMKIMNDWMNNQECVISPKVILNGDMNMPFMYDWSEEKTTELLDYYSDRLEKGKTMLTPYSHINR